MARNWAELSKRKRAKASGDWAMPPHTCTICGNTFTPARFGVKYCSHKCRKSKPRRYSECKWCGVEFGINQRKSKKVEHCSVNCYIASKTQGRYKPSLAEIELQKRIRREVAAIKRIGENIRRAISDCRICGDRFVRTRKGVRTCSAACQSSAEAQAKASRRVACRRNRKGKPWHRAQRARYKARRRARLSIVTADAVDPFTVFVRDGWRCYICGIDTPQELRGTYEPQAPELDHMVSLASGGSHSLDNLACACRRCNGDKGALDWDEYLMTG